MKEGGLRGRKTDKGRRMHEGRRIEGKEVKGRMKAETNNIKP